MLILSLVLAPMLLLAIVAAAAVLPVAVQRLAFGRAFPGLRTWLESVAVHALVIGAAAFAIGFVGPLVFAPHANQGPLLGLFITGPLGALVGAAVGSFRAYSTRRRRRAR